MATQNGLDERRDRQATGCQCATSGGYARRTKKRNGVDTSYNAIAKGKTEMKETKEDLYERIETLEKREGDKEELVKYLKRKVQSEHVFSARLSKRIGQFEEEIRYRDGLRSRTDKTVMSLCELAPNGFFWCPQCGVVHGMREELEKGFHAMLCDGCYDADN